MADFGASSSPFKKVFSATPLRFLKKPLVFERIPCGQTCGKKYF